MPRFSVPVDGDQLSLAMVALNGAGIPTIGVYPASRVGTPPPEELLRLRAVFDAGSADAAVTRVRDSLPPSGDYGIGHPVRLGPTWASALRIRVTPDPIGSLTAGLGQLGPEVKWEVSPVNAEGVCELRVETPIGLMEEAELVIAHWNAEHPGQILEPGGRS
jgi:hypothetical protein